MSARPSYASLRLLGYAALVAIGAGFAGLWMADAGRPPPLGRTTSVVLLALVAALPWSLWLRRRCGSVLVAAAHTVSCGVIAASFVRHAPTIYANDLSGHRGYLGYLKSHLLSPYGYVGGEMWHPPTWYWLQAAVVRAWSFAGRLDDVAVCQFLAAGSAFAALAFAARALVVRAGSPAAGRLAALCLLSWPTLLVQSPLLTTDVPVTIAGLLCFERLLAATANPVKTLRRRRLETAWAVAWLAVACKTSGLPLAAIVAVVTLLLSRRDAGLSAELLRPAVGLRVVVVALSALLVNSYRLIAPRLFPSGGGVASGADGLMHLGGLGHQDTVSFFTRLPTRLLSFQPGTLDSRSYLQFLFDSSLFGSAPHAFHAGWAVALMRLGALLLLAAGAWQLAVRLQRALRGLPGARLHPLETTSLVMVGVMLASGVAFTLLRKMHWCADFRFIRSLLLPAFVLEARRVSRQPPGWRQRAAMTPMLVFAGSAVAVVARTLLR
ncbi:MAG: hypothetical protein RL199_634 [Pseudomonadota bacterium]|jgi:hypothetical protein